MRKYKFRAWDGREMFNVDVLAISPCGWSCPDHGRRGVSLPYQPSVTVMQSTGLFDKNGVEIYVGDILDDSYVNPMTGEKIINLYTVMPGDDKCDACRVKHFKDSARDTLLFLINHKDRTRVVGNIYENPELLGKPKDEAHTCRVCGCTDDHACPGGCYWVEEDLCSECVGKEKGES